MSENTPVVKPHDKLGEQVLAKVMEFQKNKSIALPDNYSPENALKSAMLILAETKNKAGDFALSFCTKESIASSLLDMVIQGLNPVKKQCYFIMYGKKLTCMRSYHGAVAVAKRVAGVKSIIANAIYEGDTFKFSVDPETGMKKITEHVQDLDKMDDSKVKGAYAMVHLETGERYAEIMNIAQIEQAWKQGQQKGDSATHNNFRAEMAKKTVIGRACKSLINTSDDSDVYEEQDFANIPIQELNEEIRDNANAETIAFSDATVLNEPAKAESKPATEPGADQPASKENKEPAPF